jgi:hypothetical protein
MEILRGDVGDSEEEEQEVLPGDTHEDEQELNSPSSPLLPVLPRVRRIGSGRLMLVLPPLFPPAAAGLDEELAVWLWLVLVVLPPLPRRGCLAGEVMDEDEDGLGGPEAVSSSGGG